MPIDKNEIERVKEAIDIVAFIRSRGVKLQRKGKQFVGLCPFHNDQQPSLIVDQAKQLWNCLGACRTGGDIYRFVMKADSIDFLAAHQLLMKEAGPQPKKQTAKPTSKPTKRTTEQEKEEERPALGPVELDWLERATQHYHSCFLRAPQAQDYLKSRGLVAPEIVQTFRLGFVDGSLLRILSDEGREALKRVGLLNERGGEMMFGCVVFPLVLASTNQVINLYGRNCLQNERLNMPATRHLYLPGDRRGIFNPQGAKNADEVIITESVIDAAALWSVGIRSVIPAYGVTGLTDEIVSHLSECRVKRVALMLDADEAGRAAALEMSARLEQSNIASRIVELPAKDAAEYLTQGGTAYDICTLLAPPKDEESDKPSALEQLSDGSYLMNLDQREYRIRGLSPVGMDRLKVNVRLTVNGNFHLDTLDLYQSRSRASFAHTAAKLCNVMEQHVNADLLSLIEQLEAARLLMRKNDDESSNAPMTPQEKEAALSFLKDPRLCERIVEDFRKCGLVGERATVLTSYLGAVSRKLSEPLALLIVARSGAGKSALQDALCSFVPPEETVRVTRLTGQALFYKDPYSLQRKMLVIAEDEGAQQAVYSLRTLASDQRLSIAATRTDPNTGKLHTEHYEVYGPVVIVITTTAAEAFDEETRSRFVQLTMNESIEQTKAILEQQRKAHTLEGVLERATSEQVKRLHHNAQRLLRPLAVANPFVEMLTYPADKLVHRREQRKYLALINSIALLHQHQREIKRATRGDVELEYVEVTLSDIALANELANEVLSRALDELAPPVRGLYRELQRVYQKQSEELKCKVEDVQLSRRDIREATKWSDWQVRAYCQRLVEMEYLLAITNGNGKPTVYQLARIDDDTTRALRGLTDIQELKKRLKEKQSLDQ
jgi:DNA primase catalytic core